MKQAITNLETKTVTRRTVLGGAALVCAVASIVPPQVLAEITGANAFGGNSDAGDSNLKKANLYAFPGLRPRTAVIAATWPVRLDRFDGNARKESQVTIHAGSQKWNVTLPGDVTNDGLFEQNGCRIFAGSIATRTGAGEVALKAVVIEVPETLLVSSRPVDIWAERVMHTGLRQRVGSPFIAALVAGDAGLAKSYHRISPSEDRAMLTEAIVKAIAEKARRSGMAGDPDAHARRLAARLLPDVLHYDPQQPSGFTFAAQNGRHPEEVADLVVDTILNGFPASGSTESDIRLEQPFPFFSRHGSIA